MGTMNNVPQETGATPPKVLAADNVKSASLPRLAYSIHETAEMLGVNYITVYRLIARGKLRANTQIRHKLIPASEINRFLAV